MNIKKKLILIVGLIVMIVGILFYVLFEKNEINTNAQILIVNSYSNYAWGFQFHGTAICDDGSILTWNNVKESNLKMEYDIGTTEGLKQYILNEGKLKIRKVSNNDLEKLKEQISKLEDKIELTYPGADQGTTSIYVINTNNDKIILKCTGDCIGENQTLESKEILRIVEKYF